MMAHIVGYEGETGLLISSDAVLLRTELLNPEDLRSGVVRRYATFTWLHATRAGSSDTYAVQKITRLGSTHVPELEEFVPVTKGNLLAGS